MINHKKINRHSVIWSFGNEPTQKIYAISYDDLVYKTKISVLLTDELIGSASYLVESPLTNQLLNDKDFQELFAEEEIISFIPNDCYDVEEHFRSKSAKSPKSLSCYQDKKLLSECFAKLSSITKTIIHRPNVELSIPLRSKWIEDLFDISTKGTLGFYLHRKYSSNSEEFERIRSFCLSLAEPSNNTFVWEHIEEKIRNKNVPIEIQKYLRLRLNTLYFKVTADVLKVNIDSDNQSRKSIITADMKYNVDLFINCMAILNIDKHILGLSGHEIKALKYHPDFGHFKKKYFRMIDLASDNKELSRIFSEIYGIEKKIKKLESHKMIKVSSTDFIGAFDKYCIKISRDTGYPMELFTNTIEQYKRFNELPIIEFQDLIYRIVRNKHNNLKGGVTFMSNYDLRGANISGTAIGDHSFVLHIDKNNIEVQQLIAGLHEEVEKFDDSTIKSQLGLLVNELVKQIESKNQGKAQLIWNEIKEGLKTAGAGTTIIMAIGKLLGFLIVP